MLVYVKNVKVEGNNRQVYMWLDVYWLLCVMECIYAYLEYNKNSFQLRGPTHDWGQNCSLTLCELDLEMVMV